MASREAHAVTQDAHGWIPTLSVVCKWSSQVCAMLCCQGILAWGPERPTVRLYSQEVYGPQPQRPFTALVFVLG